MEKLEIKHLAPYLPYGLKLLFIDDISNEIEELIGLDKLSDIATNVDNYNFSDKYIKPLLAPLSNFEDKLIKDIKIELNCSHNQVMELLYLMDGSIDLEDITLGLYKILCENHIDFNKLIDKGLAVNKNTL